MEAAKTPLQRGLLFGREPYGDELHADPEEKSSLMHMDESEKEISSEHRRPWPAFGFVGIRQVFLYYSCFTIFSMCLLKENGIF